LGQVRRVPKLEAAEKISGQRLRTSARLAAGEQLLPRTFSVFLPSVRSEVEVVPVVRAFYERALPALPDRLAC